MRNKPSPTYLYLGVYTKICFTYILVGSNLCRTKHKEYMEIINQVNEFYNSAWEKLIIIGTVAFGIIGVGLPLLIQWYQKKSLYLSEEKIKNHFNSEVSALKDSIREDVKIILAEEIEKFEVKVTKMANGLDAKVFHLQAQNLLDKDEYVSSLGDFVEACAFYLNAEEFNNVQAVLDTIDEIHLKHVTKKEIENNKITHSMNLHELIVKIKKAETKGAFHIILQKIELKLASLE